MNPLHPIRSFSLWHWLPLILIASAGWFCVGAFEIFGDDFVESRMAEENWQLLRSLMGFAPAIADPHAHLFYDLEYYGALFNLVPYALFQLVGDGSSVTSYAALSFKQGCVWAVAMGTLWLLSRALDALYPSRLAVMVAALCLLMQPYYTGHAFGDMKDIGFAFAMTLASLMTARWGIWLATALHLPPPDLYRGSLRHGMLIGLCIGLASCSRVGGVALFGWVFVIGVLITAQQGMLWQRRSWIAGCLSAACAIICAFLLIWLGHPVAYARPLGWLMETIAYHSHHPNVATTLTNGEWIASTDTFWRYILLWFAAKTPLPIAALAGLGLCVMLQRAIRTRDIAATAFGAAFALQGGLFILIAVAAQAHLYMGVRQLLMVLPAIAFFAGVGLLAIWERRAYMVTKLTLAMGLLLFAEIGLNMAQLHPYYVNYFNPYFRGPAMHDRWTLFYDGKQIMRWLQAENRIHQPSADGYPALAETPTYTNAYSGALLALYAGLDESAIRRASTDEVPAESPHYLIAFSRMRFRYAPTPDCREIYRTTRKLGSETLHLGSLYFCDGTPSNSRHKRQ